MLARIALNSVVLGSLALLTGCHAGGVGNLAARPEPSLPKVSLTAKEAIEKHNLNAGRIQALEAKTRITVASASFSGGAGGRMAMERPKNFTLKMTTPMGNPVADIGSNDDEFWFWAKSNRSNKDNSILVCSYEDLDRTSLSSSFQPDWIIEAMGLRTISREEAERIESKPGDQYGTIKLVSTRRGNGGESLIKETIIETSGEIKEHRLLLNDKSGRKPVLIAFAQVTEHQTVPVNGKSDERVLLPKRFKLEWMREQLSLEISLDSVAVNMPISAENRQARFALPEIPGSKRVNLAENLAEYSPPVNPTRPSRATAEEPRARTRSSRPAPSSQPGGEIRLGNPEPLGVEGAMKRPDDPVALTADLSDRANPNALDQVVRPGIPTPNDY